MENKSEKLIAANYEFAKYFFSELKDNFDILAMEGEVLSKDEMGNIIDLSIAAEDCSTEQAGVINILKEKWLSYIEAGSGVSDGLTRVIHYISDLQARYAR
ncbi:hypothetical protein SAMN02745945_02147 [Peptoclostridium litorale DSM 5388]|uniref:Uncharacterized protein n=1 Tax=Peptoclostridium litorale DSM 5388 TaxID=1121324 RepID=A0A069RGV7_PEPLI|nr:hypothetical protein [Peptoclostridium litorale]KDR95410.1 hypothetical protein CLIT_10c01370 [Peptoclostridium litorale DSM 5388]SIO19352.1 hypothetical protein SAMN02745945_02147 [Peptoclostridium litorale DSM 5388]